MSEDAGQGRDPSEEDHVGWGCRRTLFTCGDGLGWQVQSLCSASLCTTATMSTRRTGLYDFWPMVKYGDVVKSINALVVTRYNIRFSPNFTQSNGKPS